MLSAAPPPFSSSKPTPPLLRDVRALYRRVCVLRASAKVDEADALLSGKLASAIARARESQEIPESQLEAIFAIEEDRVDTAHTLAEILLPLLIAANEASASQRNFATSRTTETEPSSETPSEPAQTAASNNSGPMLPGIADFIDEMLTQDRAPYDGRNIRRPA
jgi:hypothetical protein